MENNKRWIWSCVSRYFGLLFFLGFILFNLDAKDSFVDASIQVIFVVLTFIFIFIIPDKIIFQKYLVNKKSQSKVQGR